MRPRDFLILGLVLALGGAGFMVLGDDTHAIELPAGSTPAATAVDASASGAAEAAPAEAVLPAAMTGAQAETRQHEDTTGWKKGVIRGDIALSVAVLDRIESIQIIVKELRNAIGEDGKFTKPFSFTAPVQRGVGTPTFEVRDVDFSDYPYSVSVYSPGLNGGRSTVVVNKDHPIVDDVKLEITGGSPYTVLLRDQDANPYPQIDVRMIPVGEPPGRRDHFGTTDGYGSVVFENVLAGDYRLVALSHGMPLCEPEIATVMPGARLYSSKIQGQGYTLMAPRGIKVDFSVGDAAGYGVEGAIVKLMLTDRVRPKELELQTDHAGLASFPHVLPGVYIVNVLRDGYQSSFRQISLKDGELPPLQQFRLQRAN